MMYLYVKVTYLSDIVIHSWNLTSAFNQFSELSQALQIVNTHTPGAVGS